MTLEVSSLFIVQEHQTRSCHIPCDLYTWQVGVWGECSLLITFAQQRDCGQGIEPRTVRCVTC